MKNIKNKYGPWALITGASSGIGEEFARKLAAFNINLVLIARRKDKLEKLASELEDLYGIKILKIPVDLSDDNFLDLIASKTVDIEIGLLINNAGLGSVGDFSTVDSADEIDMIKVNCIAPVTLTRHFAKQMIERRKGGIIFLGSILSFQPTPFSAAYSATKVFNLFLGEALWFELKKYNIDVLSLNPGGTRTDFLRLSSNYNNSKIIRTTDQVVDTALKALGKKPSVVDGITNKIAVAVGKLLPRKILVNITGTISGKLDEKRRENV